MIWGLTYIVIGIILAAGYRYWAPNYKVPKHSPFTTVLTVMLWPITAVFMLITTYVAGEDN